MGRNDLTAPVFDDFIDVVHKLRKDYGSAIANPQPLLTIIQQGGLDVFGCRAMDISISIKHDGSVSLPCNGLAIERIKGNLKEIYYGNEALQQRVLQGKHPACKGCYIRCMCSASALLRIKTLPKIISSYMGSMS